MSAPTRKKAYQVLYWVEQGFRVRIEATSPAEAEAILTDMFESGEPIDEATCTTGDWHILDIDEVTP